MAAYMSGAVGTAALLGAPQAEAAVTAVTFGFGTEFSVADGGDLYWSTGGFGTLAAGATTVTLFLGREPASGYGSVYQTDSFIPSIGRASLFANGTVIGTGGNGTLGTAWFQNNSESSQDFTTDQLNQNIAFKTNTNNWGWANVSWTESTKTLTINGAFVESLAGNSITIDESLLAPAPEPSRALLALAGLGAVTLRRRRKQAA